MGPRFDDPLSPIDAYAAPGVVLEVAGYQLSIVSENGVATCYQRGQSEIFFGSDSSGGAWVLKKFLTGKDLGAAFLTAAQNQIPRREGFEAGYRRILLKEDHLNHLSRQMADWLRGALLMPRVEGKTWAELNESVRRNTRILSRSEREQLCLSLIEHVEELERSGVAHRDLSVANLIVDAQLKIHLIDWDSLFVPGIDRPAAIPIGTNGYLSPLGDTWNNTADRFGLAVLCAEFLLTDDKSISHHDGGLFEQADLSNRGGASVKAQLDRLDSIYPNVALCFRRALSARVTTEMPAPVDWKDCFAHRRNGRDASGVLIGPVRGFVQSRSKGILGIGAVVLLATFGIGTYFAAVKKAVQPSIAPYSTSTSADLGPPQSATAKADASTVAVTAPATPPTSGAAPQPSVAPVQIVEDLGADLHRENERVVVVATLAQNTDANRELKSTNKNKRVWACLKRAISGGVLCLKHVLGRNDGSYVILAGGTKGGWSEKEANEARICLSRVRPKENPPFRQVASRYAGQCLKRQFPQP